VAHPIDAILDGAPFTPLHRRVWLLASMGILLDGFDFFIMGVAIPLIREQWSPNDLEVGLITASAVLGAMVGAATLGALTDRIGRQLAFRIDLVLFVVFALASASAPGIWWLIAFRFLLGVGIGADYPISASYVAEIAPGRLRTRLLVSSFSFQAIGQLLGVVVGLVVLELHPATNAWRWMLAFGVVPALAIIRLRRRVPESPKWMLQAGRTREAAEVLSLFAGRAVQEHELRTPPVTTCGDVVPTPRWRELFTPALRGRSVLVSVPWFLMDIATYGIGVFTPTILAALAVGGSADSPVAADLASTEGAAVVDVFLVIGFALAILLVPRIGRIRMQVIGFTAMAASLSLLALVSSLPGGGGQHLPAVFVLFAVFNLFMNMGPNTTTFALPATVYPTAVRSTGAGFAAAAGKAGAATGLVLFPVLQAGLGLPPTLVVVSAGCVVAAVTTVALRRHSREEPNLREPLPDGGRATAGGR
jgi:MFS family permease